MTDGAETTTVRLLGPDDGDVRGEPGTAEDRFLIEGADTDGRFSVVEHRLGPRVLAAPLHRHTREDEYSYVLAGRVGAVLDGRTVVADAGDLLFKPRGQWHTFWNAGDEPARILELISPANLERLFRAMGDMDEPPDPETLATMAADYGCAVDFERTLPIIEEHDLEF